MTRTIMHEQDLCLVALLALDETGHGLHPGTSPDGVFHSEAIESLLASRLARKDDNGTMVLTDDGRIVAREVARRLGEARR